MGTATGLEGKAAVVTGGSRGIGRAIALRLAAEGVKVAICGRNLESAEQVVAEIEAAGAEGVAVAADISRESDADGLIQTSIKRFGRLDILVNNAGITRDNLIVRMKEEEWDQVLKVNLKGTFNCTQAVAKYMMKQRSGSIVNISSVVGIVGNAGQANYSASKAGVIGLTKSSARELASRGIRVNAVAPGFIETEMTKRLPQEYQEKLKGLIPMGVFGQPEDVASVVAFLASDDARYITGEVVKIDGGLFT